MTPKTIKGKANIPGFNTDLEVEVVDEEYEAYDKDLPKDLPERTGNGEYITWFNNFGVRRINGLEEKTVPKYKVYLQKLLEGKKLCVYYNGVVKDVPFQDAKPGRIVFSLDAGDPPVGHYP